jgi:hypothetical protein
MEIYKNKKIIKENQTFKKKPHVIDLFSSFFFCWLIRQIALYFVCAFEEIKRNFHAILKLECNEIRINVD